MGTRIGINSNIDKKDSLFQFNLVRNGYRGDKWVFAVGNYYSYIIPITAYQNNFETSKVFQISFDNKLGIYYKQEELSNYIPYYQEDDYLSGSQDIRIFGYDFESKFTIDQSNYFTFRFSQLYPEFRHQYFNDKNKGKIDNKVYFSYATQIKEGWFTVNYSNISGRYYVPGKYRNYINNYGIESFNNNYNYDNLYESQLPSYEAVGIGYYYSKKIWKQEISFNLSLNNLLNFKNPVTSIYDNQQNKDIVRYKKGLTFYFNIGVNF